MIPFCVILSFQRRICQDRWDTQELLEETSVKDKEERGMVKLGESSVSDLWKERIKGKSWVEEASHCNIFLRKPQLGWWGSLEQGLGESCIGQKCPNSRASAVLSLCQRSAQKKPGLSVVATVEPKVRERERETLSASILSGSWREIWVYL